MTSPTLNYPISRQQDLVEFYHNVAVKDPYRWLENPYSEET